MAVSDQWRMRWPVNHFAEIDSTNSEAMRRAARGEQGPLWVVADRQTAGRGRSGRSWSSEAGNLYATLLVPLDVSAASAQQLSLVAGVAVVDAIARAARSQAPGGIGGLRLKWPNDVLIGAAKCAGILIESTMVGGRMQAAIGIGVNLAGHPRMADRATTDLSSHGVMLSPVECLGYISHDLDRALDTWCAGTGFGAIRDAWLERAGPKGERISVNRGRSVAQGLFAGIDGTGALLLQSRDGSISSVSFGDISLMNEFARGAAEQ